ncbi:MAG TPA: T9SS type A sorting domain-containing protein [Flavobacteriales bacterium]|nr:T9SS type A sorting domain-containing protein [Flavobacteriales bacterium]
MRTLLVLLMWLATLPGIGQSWFPEGATWYYDYGEGFPPLFVGYIHMQAAGDTILAQELSVKLEKRRRYWLTGTSQMYEVPYGTHVVNESEGLVRIWVPSEQAYDTLYDMRVVPGDRWQLAPLSAPIVCDPSSYAQVLDTGHVTIDGVPLRWLTVDHHYLLDGSEYTVWTDTIIERMGLNLSYFTPHELCNAAADGGEGGPLRCYSDAEIGFNRFEPWSCEFVLSVADKPLPIEKLAVWPNPGNDDLHLDPAGRPLLSVELRDALGRTVLERMSTLNNNPIDVSSLAPGTYVVLARTAQGERLVANWIKQ